MTNPTHGSLRVTRAAVFGAIAFALSWAAHVAAGGASPGGGALVLLAVLTGLGATVVTRWRLGPAPLVVTLGVAQVALHEALMWLGSTSSGATCASGQHCGSAMPTMPMPGMTMPTMSLSAPAAHPAAPSSAWMLVAHAAATVVLALLLAVGERALWFLATLLRPALRGTIELPAVPSSTRVRAYRHSTWAGPRPFVRHGTARRGPPASLALIAA